MSPNFITLCAAAGGAIRAFLREGQKCCHAVSALWHKGLNPDGPTIGPSRARTRYAKARRALAQPVADANTNPECEFSQKPQAREVAAVIPHGLSVDCSVTERAW